MDSSESTYKRRYLSRKNSRILLTFLILCTVFLSYLAALGIKAAGENEEFQEAMEIMQRDANPEAPIDQIFIDSTSVHSSNEDSLR